MSYELIVDDCRRALAGMPEASVHTVMTSPPYWGLRDYGFEGQIGLEPTPEAYVETLVKVFREVRRVLRPDGTLWLNLGDSYASQPPGIKNADRYKASGLANPAGLRDGVLAAEVSNKLDTSRLLGIKQKNLIGIPWRVAFALQADGWYLRSDIIWSKPNPMPESVTDRPTRSHEYLFLLTRSPRYYYDAEAIRERGIEPDRKRADRIGGSNGHVVRHSPGGIVSASTTRNCRSVWTIPTQPYPEAHFATFPPKLVEPCILAGTSERGCCANCGAPWKRVVKRTTVRQLADEARTWQPRPKADGYARVAASSQRADKTTGLSASNSHNATTPQSPVTVATWWQPGCECDADIVPCTVLDPFAGSGTVGEVALKLGRRAVLVEASAEYAELIRKRLAPIAAQPSLFDLGGAA